MKKTLSAIVIVGSLCLIAGGLMLVIRKYQENAKREYTAIYENANNNTTVKVYNIDENTIVALFATPDDTFEITAYYDEEHEYYIAKTINSYRFIFAKDEFDFRVILDTTTNDENQKYVGKYSKIDDYSIEKMYSDLGYVTNLNSELDGIYKKDDIIIKLLRINEAVIQVNIRGSYKDSKDNSVSIYDDYLFNGDKNILNSYSNDITITKDNNKLIVVSKDKNYIEGTFEKTGEYKMEDIIKDYFKVEKK